VQLDWGGPRSELRRTVARLRRCHACATLTTKRGFLNLKGKGRDPGLPNFCVIR
jgi:hypothetical protein